MSAELVSGIVIWIGLIGVTLELKRIRKALEYPEEEGE